MITGIGSLPSLGAMELVTLACPTLPFWPQDPSSGPYGTMIGESLVGLETMLRPLDAGVRFEVTEPNTFLRLLREGKLPDPPGALQRFERLLAAGRFARADGVKGQIVGPATLATCLEHQGAPLDKVLPHDELLSALALRLSVLASQQIKTLEVGGVPVQLWVDEPCLPGSSLPAQKAVKTLLKAIRGSGARAGIHCCAPPPLAILLSLEAEVVSFDAWNGLEAFCADPLTPSLLKSTRRIAWGVMPTSPDVVRTLSVEGLVDRWISATRALGDAAELRRRALFTATCGLGTLALDDALRAFAALTEFDDRLRAICDS